MLNKGGIYAMVHSDLRTNFRDGIVEKSIKVMRKDGIIDEVIKKKMMESFSSDEETIDRLLEQ